MLSNIEIVAGSPLQQAIDSIQNPAVPFVDVVFKKTKTIKKTSMEIEVHESTYDWIVKNLGSDHVPLFLTPNANPISSWSPDMRVSFEIMEGLGLMSGYDSWCRIARGTLDDLLRNKTDFKQRRKDSLINVCEELLLACGIGDPEARCSKLMPIAKNAIDSKARDPDTTVYRLAMLVFHYALNVPATVKGIENWETAYLEFAQNKEIPEKYALINDKLKKIHPSSRQLSFKTIFSFIVGAYLYYKGVKELGIR